MGLGARRQQRTHPCRVPLHFGCGGALALTKARHVDCTHETSEKGDAMDYEIRVEQLAQRDVAAVKLRGKAADLPVQLPAAFGAVVAYLQRQGISPRGPAVAIYDQRGGDQLEVAAGFYVPSRIEGDGHVVPAVIPACSAAVTTHVGSYDELARAYAAMRSWMQREGREPADTTMWEEYSSGPETPSEQARTDVYWPLRSAR